MQRTRQLSKIFKYPEYAGATKDQASIGKVWQRLKDGIPHYYARSPGHFSKLRGILTHGARMSEFRCGTLVGEDKYGNRYFENNDYTLGRNRWWIPHDRCTEEMWNYDANDIPAEWHRWMTHMTDKPPTSHPPPPRVFYIDHARTPTRCSDQWGQSQGTQCMTSKAILDEIKGIRSDANILKNSISRLIKDAENRDALRTAVEFQPENVVDSSTSPEMSSLQNHPDFTLLQQQNHDLQAQLEQFQVVFQDLIKENSSLKQKFEDKQADFEKMYAEFEIEKKQCAEKNQVDMDKIIKELEIIKAERVVIFQERNKFEGLYGQVLKESNELQKQKEEMENMFHEMVKKNGELESRLKNEESDPKQNWEKFSEEEKSAKNNSEKADCSEITEKLKVLQINLEQQESYCKNLEAENSTLKQSLNQINTQRGNDNEKTAELEVTIKNYQTELSEQKSALETQKTKLFEQSEELNSKIKQLSEESAKNNQLAARNKELTEKHKTLASDYKKSQDQLQQFSEHLKIQTEQSNKKISNLEENLRDNESIVNTLTQSNSELNNKLNKLSEELSISASKLTQSSENKQQIQTEFLKKQQKFIETKESLENEILVQKTANLGLAEQIEDMNRLKDNEIKIYKDKLLNLDRIKSNDVEKFKLESDKLKQQCEELKIQMRDSTKNLREELKTDREQMRKQCKIERENADNARNELIESCKKLEESKNLLKAEKSVRLELEKEAEKLREQIFEMNKVANGTKMAMYELAREQEKMQKEKVVKECIVWTNDDSVTNCCGCGDNFGVFNRKHHCRACGKIFCGICSAHKIRIPGQVMKEAQRVCNACAQNLMKR